MGESFKDYKIKKKLRVAFSGIIITFVIFMLIGMASVSMVAGSVNRFYNNAYAVTQASLKTKEAFVLIQKTIYQLASNFDKTEALLQQLDSYSAQFNENFQILSEKYKGDAKLLEEFKSEMVGSADTRNKILELINNKDSNASKVLEDEYMPVIQSCEEKLDVFIKEANIQAQNFVEQSSRTKLFSMGLLALVFLLGFLYIVVIYRKLFKCLTVPIEELDLAISKFSQGYLKVDFKYSSGDELGTLVKNLESMMSTLMNYITNIREVLGRIAQKDMTVEVDVEYMGDFAPIRTAMETITQAMGETISVISQSSNHVTQTANEIANASQSIAEGAMNQASTIEELLATVNDIAGEVSDNAKDSENVTAVSQKSVERVETGNEYMQKLLEIMNKITSSAEEISKITQMVGEVSEETNLLSLNASIEAARAGEHGKGFAVVASEIGNLANESARSTKEIEKLVNETLKVVADGARMASETAQVLSGVVESSEETNQLIGHISTACNRQAYALDQVVKGLEEVSNVVQGNSAVSEETSASSQELLIGAEEVSEIIARFKIN